MTNISIQEKAREPLEKERDQSSMLRVADTMDNGPTHVLVLGSSQGRSLILREVSGLRLVI